MRLQTSHYFSCSLVCRDNSFGSPIFLSFIAWDMYLITLQQLKLQLFCSIMVWRLCFFCAGTCIECNKIMVFFLSKHSLSLDTQIYIYVCLYFAEFNHEQLSWLSGDFPNFAPFPISRSAVELSRPVLAILDSNSQHSTCGANALSLWATAAALAIINKRAIPW